MRRHVLRAFLLLGLLLAAPAGSALMAADDPAPGIQLFTSGRFEEARKFFADYLARDPRSAAAAFHLGRRVATRS